MQDDKQFNKVVRDNSELLGITKLGLSMLDSHYRHSYNYQHQGMPKRPTLEDPRQKERQKGIELENSSMDSEEQLSSLDQSLIQDP